MNRELAQDFCVEGRPGDQLGFLSERASRQAREVSPKQDPACAPAVFFEPSPRLRGLAWARSPRLGEITSPERDPPA
ncbi:hypothetical protein DEO72_LG3g1029 [Vigna unguiculata]|uniref:Uncharacterized protein n=1 Tax=Vigna unguiculata TaxID=3917 RepID=A0A4D6LDM9_VIGUN|nr:hypothetical protein DEO72_LG3g1029 [Vigna unguiculata]